jgi:SAM-dependent methyltransferase
MKWQVKAAVDTGKTFIPFYSTIRQWKRRFVPFQERPAVLTCTLEDGIRQVEALARLPFCLTEKQFLELGTGWYPLIPMLFRVCGFSRGYLVDAERLVDERLVVHAATILSQSSATIVNRLNLRTNDVAERLALDASGNAHNMLASVGLHYNAPVDARRLSLESGTIDLITSRAVLEHIAPHILHDLCREFYRLLPPGGVMCHLIDNADHFRIVDKSISYVHFLRYSDRVWNLLSLGNYQNRLRHSQYRTLFEHAGFHVVYEEATVNDEALDSLTRMSIDDSFCGFALTDLATIESLFILQKPPLNGGAVRAIAARLPSK